MPPIIQKLHKTPNDRPDMFIHSETALWRNTVLFFKKILIFVTNKWPKLVSVSSPQGHIFSLIFPWKTSSETLKTMQPHSLIKSVSEVTVWNRLDRFPSAPERLPPASLWCEEFRMCETELLHSSAAAETFHGYQASSLMVLILEGGNKIQWCVRGLIQFRVHIGHLSARLNVRFKQLWRQLNEDATVIKAFY